MPTRASRHSVPHANTADRGGMATLRACLIDMTHELNAEIGEEIEIRVGVASGHIHAGFLGRHKVAYELYGGQVRGTLALVGLSPVNGRWARGLVFKPTVDKFSFSFSIDFFLNV